MFREISFQVSSSGITPYTVQHAGVQGEQNVTRLSFTIDSNLQSKLTEAANGATLYYRFDTYDSFGCSNSTEPNALEDKYKVYYDVGLQLSAVGGNAKVYLVITAIADDNTHAELISFPALINFTKKAGAEYEQAQKESLSALYVGAAKSAEAAAKSEKISTENARAAEIAREQTEKVKPTIDQTYNPESENAQSGKAIAGALEPYVSVDEEMEWVFDGGNSSDSVKIELVVDDAISPTSKKPVSNRAITNYVNEKAAENIAYVDGKLVDYFVEQGTDGIWTYEKRASGICKCWGLSEIFTENYVAEGSGFVSEIHQVKLPSNLFKSVTSYQAHPLYPHTYLDTCLIRDENKYFEISSARFGAQNNVNLQYSMEVIGTWR